MSFIIRLRKENFKFSCSHFTIFGPTQAERLHGHNYYVAVDLKVDEVSDDLGLAFDFNLVKPLIRKVCDGLDEYVLIPKNSPYLKVTAVKGDVEVHYGAKRYVLPQDDVKLLPLVNITSEELARYFTEQVLAQLPKNLQVLDIAVTVKETQGQSVTYRKHLN